MRTGQKRNLVRDRKIERGSNIDSEIATKERSETEDGLCAGSFVRLLGSKRAPSREGRNKFAGANLCMGSD